MLEGVGHSPHHARPRQRGRGDHRSRAARARGEAYMATARRMGRTRTSGRAALGADQRDAHVVGRAGRAERHAGDDDDPLARSAAKPSMKACRQARSAMSRSSRASSVTTACTPQTSARRRAVATIGVSARIGERGRSRAMRRPVEPDAVQAQMTFERQRLGDVAGRDRDRVGAGRLRRRRAARR